MKEIRKVLCFLLIVAQCFSGVVFALDEKAAESSNVSIYAKVDFQKPEEIVGMSMVLNQHAYVEKGGRTGISLGSTNADWIAYFNIDDKMAYDIPDDTQVAITVDYYDEGNGFFEIAYDGHRVDTLKVPKTGVDRIGIWNNTELIRLENTGEWKTYTFYMDDIRMANRLAGSDFRIATWTISTGISPENVVIGEVTVETVEYPNPLRIVEVTTNEYGNIYGDGEDMGMKFLLKNRASDDLNGKIIWTATDEKGQEVYRREDTKLFPAKQDTPYELDLTLEKYGRYFLTVSFEGNYANDLNKKVIPIIKNYEFSKAWKVSKDKLNPKFGTGLYTATLKWSAENGVGAAIAADAGLGWGSEEVAWRLIETAPGNYKIPDRAQREIDLAANEGLMVNTGFIYNNPLYWDGQILNDPPSTKEQFEAWGNWVEWLSRETKGKVQSFRMWNEYNWQSFNVNNDSPENYVELMKVTYDRAKKGNPDVILSGLETAGINHDFNRRIFEAGGLDYMDVVAVHPYDWSGHFDTRSLIEKSNILKDMLAEYGHPDKPIWWTEFGFGQGYSLEYQAACFVMSYCLMECFDLADAAFQFRFQNDDIVKEPTDGEAVWGLVWNYLDKGRENGAKPSYLAIAAMNNLIGVTAEPNGVIQDETNYAFRFNNTEMQKDVAVLMSEYDNNYMTFDFGTEQIEVYDMYGNKIKTTGSENGIYSFVVNQIPVYVVGNFGEFKQVDNSKAMFYPENFEASVVAGERVTYTFRERVENNLQVVVEENEFFTIEQNNGFKDGCAQVVLFTNKDMPETVEFDMQLVNQQGQVVYSGTHTIHRVEPIKIDISSELAVAGSDHWKAKVVITNQSREKSISGVLRVVAPETEAKLARPRAFKSVNPGESLEIHMSLPTRIIKKSFDLEVEVALANGYRKTEVQKMDFSSAAYAITKPIIDGVRESGEWYGNWFGANEDGQYNTDNYIGWETWNGPDDSSFVGVAMWDETDLYILMYAVDDVHHTEFDGEISNLWKTDSIQFAVDDRNDKNPVGKNTLNEIGIADVPGHGVLAWRYSSIYGLPISKQVTNCDIAMKRYDGYTVYECRFPWTELISESFEAKAGFKIRFSALLNDSDSKKTRGWMMYNGGITPNKDVDLLGYMELLK